MRYSLIVVSTLAIFWSGAALAEDPKAPACEPNLRGVMWNFGSESNPDIRRCDGISYIPYGHELRGEVTKGDPKHACSDACVSDKRSCEASCGLSIFDTDCRRRCQRTQVQCETKC